MIKKRILYLSNHVTLSKFEIPMLQKMGYEIYMPKKTDFDISCTINWELDHTLTIPQDDLHTLNQTDFYYTPISSQVSEIINKYFDIAFMVSYPVMFSSVIKHFNGAIVFRAFGNHSSYTQIFQAMFGISIFTKIEKLGNRFWFGSGYETIPVIEGRLLKMRDIFLPLGLPNATVKDRWKGQGKKILFPCPKINTMPYFQEVYQKFLKDFDGIPYTVCGVQPIPVNDDPNVVGYLSDAEYEQVYSTSSCMYYYSQIKTHIHYTPAEAVKWGLPLVFMANGLLDSLGGKDLPGRCENIKEARSKIKRLIKGDNTLAEKIRASQPVLLEKFSYDYCEPIWKKSIKKIVDNLEYDYEKSKIKLTSSRLAIILPITTINILFYTAFALIKSLATSIKENKQNIKIVLAYPNDTGNKNEDYIKQLDVYGVELRKFSWEQVTIERIKDIASIKDYSEYLGYHKYYFLLNDGISYFHDCDHLLFISNEIPGNIFTEIPYGVLTMDFMVRNKDSVFDNDNNNAYLAFIRNSQFCLVNSPIMKEHAIQYAGVPKNNIFQIPYLIEECENRNYSYKSSKTKQYIFCLVSQKENFHSILEALKKYYLCEGHYRCIIYIEESVGETASESVTDLKKYIKHIPILRKNINIFAGYDKEELQILIRNAECLISIGEAYGGNLQSFYYTLQSGTKLFLSQSKSNEYINKYFNLNAILYDLSNPKLLTKLLFELDYSQETFHKSQYIDCPDYTSSNTNIAAQIYDIIKYNCCL